MRRAKGVEALADADGAATLAEFTVESVAAALRHVPRAPARWLVTGGGRRNAHFMRRLRERLGVRVDPVEAVGWDGDFLEAQSLRLSRRPLDARPALEPADHHRRSAADARRRIASRCMSEPLLSVENFSMSIGGAPVVEDVSFHLMPGEMLGLVGESGCGKTVTALSVMRLFPEPPGRITGGRIVFEGDDLLKKGAAALRAIRGDRIGMIFQEPMTSLNPVFTIGDQIAEAVLLHRAVGRAAARTRAIELLDLVGIPLARDSARPLPAPDLGRPAPARDDRDRARLRPEAPHRRRADDRPRRHRPGPDPRPASTA